MPKKKEVLEESVAVEPEVPKVKADTSRIRVFNSRGIFIREYTEADSTEELSFKEKAEGFAGKIGGRWEYPILFG